MSTERFESTWRKNVSSVCFKERQERQLRSTRTCHSLGITVVHRHWRIGPERRSPIEHERTVQHSRYSWSWVCQTQRTIAKERCLPKTMCCDFSKAASLSHR